MTSELLDKVEKIKDFAKSLDVKIEDHYWDDDDPEWGHDSVEEAADSLCEGEEMTLQVGFIISPRLKVKRIAIDEDNSEIIVVETPAASGEKESK